MDQKKNIEACQKVSCTGCRMCADICPQKCISFAEDEEGFLYPVIEGEKCVNCGLCIHVCPTQKMSLNPKVKNVFSAFASDKSAHKSGSSGGIFWILANAVLNMGGVVYGAAFDASLRLKHRRVDRVEELRPLCKSKYLQSDCGGIYQLVKGDLQSGKRVLFSGTPCQCQALRNFIGERLDANCILVDFVCHGVPNQHLFDDNIDWNSKKYGCIKSVEFRCKDGLHPQSLKMVYEIAGKEKSCIRLHYQDPFYFGFQKHTTLRPSCYQCMWARPQRCSDITIADFWGIEKLCNGLDSKKGVSCILLNTKEGVQLFGEIKPYLSGVQSVSIEFAIKNNECLGNPTKEPIDRTAFFEDWQKNGYSAVVKKYLIPKRKWVFDLYYAIPGPIRKIVRRIMDKKIKYE